MWRKLFMRKDLGYTWTALFGCELPCVAAVATMSFSRSPELRRSMVEAVVGLVMRLGVEQSPGTLSGAQIKGL